jgi:predicted murein hydrolase (TIGR00659 family)
MSEFLPLFFFAATCLIYYLAKRLYERFRLFFLHPVLLSVTVIILFLRLTGVSYATYMEGGGLISFFLSPAVVALGVPLYLNLAMIRRKALGILASLLAGSLAGILSVLWLAKLLGASPGVAASLAPKSVTSAIAMDVAGSIGGFPPLAAAVVIVVGVFGAIFGVSILRLIRVREPAAVGLAMGAACHGLGTARVAELGEEYSAYGGLALSLNGIFTAILVPPIYHLFYAL